MPKSYVPSRNIRKIRMIVRTRIKINKTITSYKNRIRFEMLRMHADYENDHFTIKGIKFLINLKSNRIGSYLNDLKGLNKEIKRIDK